MTTGQRIQMARKQAKLTQAKLGAKLGVSGSMIGQYENDLRNPKYDTLSRIAVALGVSLAYLQGWDDAISDLEAAGMSVNDIADEMGIPADQILKIVNDQGVYSAEATAKIVRVASLLAKECTGNPQQPCGNSKRSESFPDMTDKTVTFQPFTETDAKLIELGGFGAISEFYNLPEEAQKKALEDIRGFVEYVIDKYKKQSSEDK